MAKVISDEILKLKIVVNGDEAQKRVLDLELANKRLGITSKDLQEKQAQLSRQRKKDSDEYKQNAAAIQSLTKAIADNKKSIDEEIKAMDIMSLTLEQLRRRYQDLQYVRNNMNPNSPEYARASEELQRLNGRMSELRTGASASSMSISNLAGKFNHYSGVLTAALATMAGVAVSIQSTIDLNNKLADAQTAVAKTTGLSNDEVKELTQSFSEFDTRTSRMDLLKIAEVGGRLGVPKEEIKSFTQEVDKMYVALGDSFQGGAEQVANQLGKIKNLFGETKDLDMATAFNQIGSALNELGAAGAASEANIADFTLRVGALPANLKPSVAETMALGAAFEESGIDAERAGTAYSTFVRTAAKESGAFAEVMGITKKEVDDLINKDPMQFFLKFAEDAKGLDTTAMANMLDHLKLNDQYVVSILGAASENTDRFRKTIELSNQALTEATSLQDEFNKVNNNAAAIYEKVRKSIIGAFTSDNVAKGLSWIIESIGKMIGAGEDADGRWRAIGATFMFVTKLITLFVVGLVSFNTAMAISNLTVGTAKAKLLEYTIIQKANNALNSAGAVLQNLYTAAVARTQLAYALLTRNIEMQAAAQARLNLITKANPFALLVTVVIAAATAYALFADRADEAASKQKALNDVRTATAGKIAEEKAELEKLVAVAKSESSTNEQRAEALRRLNNIIPDHIGLLTQQNIRTAEGVGIINRYIDALNRKAYAEAVGEKQKELLKKQVDLQGAGVKKGYEDLGGVGTFFEKTFSGNKLKTEMSVEDAKRLDYMTKTADVEKELAKYIPIVQTAYRKRRDELRQNYNELKAINAEQKKLIQTDPGSVLGDGGGSKYKTDFGSGKTPKSGGKSTTPRKSDAELAAEKAAKEWERQKEEMLKNGEQAKELAQELEVDKLNAVAEVQKDWYLREQIQIKAEGQAKLDELNKKIITEGEFKELDSIIAKTKDNERAKFEAIKQQWLDNNKDLEDLKTKATETTNFKLAALDEKKKAEDLKRDEAEFMRRIALQKAESDSTIANLTTVESQKLFLRDKISEEELQKITTWEEGKIAIEQYYQEQSLTMQQQYLQSLVDELNKIPPANLTKEQAEALEALRIKLAEIAKTKAEMQNGHQPKGIGKKLEQFGGGSADLFGLTPDQWEAMFAKTDTMEQKIQKVGAAIQVAQQIFAQYAAFAKANEDAMMRKMEVNSDRKKKKLKQELDSGLINQEAYKKLTLQNDAELDKKKAELEYKAAKRQRAMQIAQAIAGTAMAVINALNTQPFFPLGLAMSVIAGVAGAVQIATILKQPLPSATGAEDGLYPVLREQDGKRFDAQRRPLASGLYDQPTVLVGEGGKNYPEMVIDGRTMKRLKPSTVQQLNSEIAQVRGFEDGLYPQQKNRPTGDDAMLMVVSALERYTNIMEKIERDGIQGVFDKGPKVGKELKDSIKSYDELRNKNKHG